MRNNLGSFFVGDELLLTSLAVVDAPDSMTVSVWDSDDVKQIDEVSMTVDPDNNKKFTYNFQTNSDWASGTCDIITTTSKDGGENKQDDFFKLVALSH